MKNVITKFLHYPISAIAIIGFSLNASDITISKYNIFEPLISKLDKTEVLQNGAPYLQYAVQTAGCVTGFLGMSYLCPAVIPCMSAKITLGAACTGFLIGTGLIGLRVSRRDALTRKYNYNVEICQKLSDEFWLHQPDWNTMFLSSMHTNFIKPMLYCSALMSFGLFIALINKHKVSLY